MTTNRQSNTNRRNLYIHPEDYAYLKQIGGTYAEGLRRAVEAHRHVEQRQANENIVRHGEAPAKTKRR